MGYVSPRVCECLTLVAAQFVPHFDAQLMKLHFLEVLFVLKQLVQYSLDVEANMEVKVHFYFIVYVLKLRLRLVYVLKMLQHVV